MLIPRRGNSLLLSCLIVFLLLFVLRLLLDLSSSCLPVEWQFYHKRRSPHRKPPLQKQGFTFKAVRQEHRGYSAQHFRKPQQSSVPLPWRNSNQIVSIILDAHNIGLINLWNYMHALHKYLSHLLEQSWTNEHLLEHGQLKFSRIACQVVLGWPVKSAPSRPGLLLQVHDLWHCFLRKNLRSRHFGGLEEGWFLGVLGLGFSGGMMTFLWVCVRWCAQPLLKWLYSPVWVGRCWFTCHTWWLFHVPWLLPVVFSCLHSWRFLFCAGLELVGNFYDRHNALRPLLIIP